MLFFYINVNYENICDNTACKDAECQAVNMLHKANLQMFNILAFTFNLSTPKKNKLKLYQSVSLNIISFIQFYFKID